MAVKQTAALLLNSKPRDLFGIDNNPSLSPHPFLIFLPNNVL